MYSCAIESYPKTCKIMKDELNEGLHEHSILLGFYLFIVYYNFKEYLN